MLFYLNICLVNSENIGRNINLKNGFSRGKPRISILVILLPLEKSYLNDELFLPGRIAKYCNGKEFINFIRSLFKIKWLTYAKRPFAGPEQVLEYLGRYTHRIAISNNRIKSIDNNQVGFEYRDRADNNTVKILKIKGFGNPNMLFATHIFFADELNIRANRPIKNYPIPIAASAPI
jgi:hypothetical protein